MKKGYYLIFILLTVFCKQGYSGQADSLRQQYRKAKLGKNFYNDTANIKLLTSLSLALRTENTDTALFYSKEALKVAQNTQYDLGEANAWASIGGTYYVKGSYFLSLEAVTKLLNISHRINYKKGIGDAHQLRGLIYLGQDEFKDAIREFSKALNIYRQLGNKFKMSRMLFDIGLSYDELRDSARAFQYLKQAREMGMATHDNQIVAMSYNRMGETHYHFKQYDTALVYHNKVLRGNYQDKWENAFAYSGLAQSQFELKLYKQAQQNALTSFTLASQVNSLWDQVRALKILGKAYAATGNFEQAYKYNALMTAYNDSLLNESKERNLNYLHLQQQRTENLTLEKQNEVEQQKTRFNMLLMIAIGVMAVCISVFAFIMSRSNIQKSNLNTKLERRNKSIARQKEEISIQNEKLDALNHTKNQLFSVISHDLRGPFASITQTIELIRDDELTDEERDRILEHFYKQVAQISAMVNNLLLWANSQLEGNITQPALLDATKIVNEIKGVSAYLSDSKKVALIHDYNSPKPVYADADHLKIIIQNLLGNAIKFTPQGGTVSIYYTEDTDYQAIHIKDTGVGISLEKMGQLFKVVGKSISAYGTNHEQGAGIGLLLIKQFTEVNKGRLTIHSEPGAGTEVTVYLPKKAHQ
ncbi:tetratricopeptide repeat-containing sensor histidine kinase [Mucilaginibacter roseus]|uniref:histidine kinase n=1 Tax=Mucilaginibacter roseus TaxID=1528868 RepID=A0ABS8U8Q4_9SPHI|nr:tetratricopeptide repeat-containing sensor histidine kinase [Mucilaginibacter roseus]MCD8742605.1 tetratricopeptide repeat-containing sensor histidine kinase [Mucilaginibacter roseus]